MGVAWAGAACIIDLSILAFFIRPLSESGSVYLIIGLHHRRMDRLRAHREERCRAFDRAFPSGAMTWIDVIILARFSSPTAVQLRLSSGVMRIWAIGKSPLLLEVFAARVVASAGCLPCLPELSRVPLRRPRVRFTRRSSIPGGRRRFRSMHSISRATITTTGFGDINLAGTLGSSPRSSR